MEIEEDSETYEYGEVSRSVEYDEFGYLEYSGLDIEEIDET